MFMLLAWLLSAVAGAQVYEGCRDYRGVPVISVEDYTLQDVAVATLLPNGKPIIKYNPNVLSRFQPATRRWWYGHECGHHALAHGVRNIPFQQEQEADCFGIVSLVRDHGFTCANVQTVKQDLAALTSGSWLHLPGPARAVNIDRCLAEAGLNPCGVQQRQCRTERVPCTHPAHPWDEVGCVHLCPGWVPCHPFDRVPCQHPRHPQGHPVERCD